MNNYLELISVPAIATVVYWVIEIIKYTVKGSEKFKRFIPIVATLIGAICGIVCFYLVPNIMPTENLVVAIVLGASSGLTATGVNQLAKQLKKKDAGNGE